MARLLLLVAALFVLTGVVSANGHGQGQPATFNCQEDGYFADTGRKCVVYYRCANGDLTAFGCDKGFLFDQGKSRCLPSATVSC
nr:uncharacterized protein LOC123764922 [Procambarus clarkii]